MLKLKIWRMIIIKIAKIIIHRLMKKNYHPIFNLKIAYKEIQINKAVVIIQVCQWIIKIIRSTTMINKFLDPLSRINITKNYRKMKLRIHSK
jgi:hypothetical protein